MRYDRGRNDLDRHPNDILAAYMASGTEGHRRSPSSGHGVKVSQASFDFKYVKFLPSMT